MGSLGPPLGPRGPGLGPQRLRAGPPWGLRADFFSSFLFEFFKLFEKVSFWCICKFTRVWGGFGSIGHGEKQPRPYFQLWSSILEQSRNGFQTTFYKLYEKTAFFTPWGKEFTTTNAEIARKRFQAYGQRRLRLWRQSLQVRGVISCRTSAREKPMFVELFNRSVRSTHSASREDKGLRV